MRRTYVGLLASPRRWAAYMGKAFPRQSMALTFIQPFDGEALAEARELGLQFLAHQPDDVIARSSTSVSETGKTPGRCG